MTLLRVGCCALVFASVARAQAPARHSLRAGPLRPLFESQALPPGTPSGNSRPEIEPARVVGQLFAGTYAGIGGYVLGSWAGGLLAETLPASDNTKDQIAFGAGVIGGGLATAASVAAIGNIGDQTGSYRMALAGAGAGIAAAVLINQLIYGHARLPDTGSSSKMRWLEASLEALLPSLGATIAFNSTRRYK